MTKLAPRPVERIEKLPHALEAEVGFAALNCSDISTINVGALRERLLRQLKLLAPLS